LLEWPCPPNHETRKDFRFGGEIRRILFLISYNSHCRSFYPTTATTSHNNFQLRPSGPEWYVNILNNTADHGPGTQQEENPYEADSNFGRVIEGMDTVIQRIHAMPQHEFFEEEYYIKIPAMHILVAQGTTGEFVEWSPH
jgi:hypothetical protein